MYARSLLDNSILQNPASSPQSDPLLDFFSSVTTSLQRERSTTTTTTRPNVVNGFFIGSPVGLRTTTTTTTTPRTVGGGWSWVVGEGSSAGAEQGADQFTSTTAGLASQSSLLSSLNFYTGETAAITEASTATTRGGWNYQDVFDRLLAANSRNRQRTTTRTTPQRTTTRRITRRTTRSTTLRTTTRATTTTTADPLAGLGESLRGGAGLADTSAGLAPAARSFVQTVNTVGWRLFRELADTRSADFVS